MMTTNTRISHISKSNDSIHIKSAINCGEQISCQLSDSFSNGISDGDVLLISDNGNLNAHQSILSCSPLLKNLFESMGSSEQSIFYDRAYFTVYLPSFNVLSVKALLQFLYTGEVELTSGSITTSEFSELCKVLRINPPVNKYRKYQSKKSTPQKQDKELNLHENKEQSVNKQETIDNSSLKNEQNETLDTEKAHHIQSTFQASNSRMSTSASSDTEVTSAIVNHQLPPLSKIYSCEVCLKKFDVQSKLRFHNIKKHNNTNKSSKPHATSTDKDTEREASKPKNVENEMSFEVDKDVTYNQKIKDEEEKDETVITKITYNCDQKPNVKETDMISAKNLILEPSKEKIFKTDVSDGDEEKKNMIEPKSDDDNHFSQVNDPQKKDENETINKDGLNVNNSIPDDIEFDDNQDHKPLIIDEEHYATTSKDLEKTSCTLNTDSILENSDFQSNTTREQSVDDSGFVEPEDTNLELQGEDISKEEFKMPDNFDLPEDYFISIKRSTTSHQQNSELSSKTLPSLMEGDRISSHPAANHDKTTKHRNRMNNRKEQSKLVPLVSRSIYPSAKPFDRGTTDAKVDAPERMKKLSAENSSPKKEQLEQQTISSQSERLLKTVDIFSGELTKDLPSLKKKKRMSRLFSDEKLRKARERKTNENFNITHTKPHRSVEDELAEKRARMVGLFKREEKVKFHEKDDSRKENDRSLKRSNSQTISQNRSKNIKKKKPRPSISSDPSHICSSACPANHWMVEDQEWIEDDVTTEEDTGWFPDCTSETSVSSNCASDEEESSIHSEKKHSSHDKKLHHEKSRHGKRIKIMPLQNSFSATETEESNDEDNSPRTEKISPQKPRKLRMMERSKKRWHRIFNPQSKKATVTVQLNEVTEIMDFSTYLITLEEKQNEDTDIENNSENKSPCASGSKEYESSSSASKDKKYRRIKLFHSSSSSSDTESENKKVNKKRKHKKHKTTEKQEEDDEVEETVWTPFTYRSFDYSKAKPGSGESSQSDHHSYKKHKGKEHHKTSSSHEKHGKERHSSSHHKSPPSVDESHHSRHSKERSHSVSPSKRKIDILQRSHSFIPSTSYKKSKDLSKFNFKSKEDRSNSTFSYGLSPEKQKEKNGSEDGINKIMQMSFRKKKHESDQVKRE